MSASKANYNRDQSRLAVQKPVKKTEKWDVYSTGRQNLAAALNDPHHRDLGLFTRTWGESFVHTTPIPPWNSPVVSKDDFLEYMRRTREGRRVHARVNRELNLTSLVSPQEKLPPSCDTMVLEQDGRTFDLNAVPRIYFMSSFSLENQKTFSEILPIEDVLGLGENQERHDARRKHKTAPTDKLLHEQLTHYLDMVEVHLAHQIAQRADTFFASMTSHDMLNNEIQALLFHLTEARNNLKRSNRTVALDHLKLLHFSAKRYRCQLVYNKMKVLWAVQQTPPTIKLLLSTMDFVGALELIASTKDALQTELVGVHCVRHLYSELDELEKAIEQMMQDDFASLVLEYIRESMKHQTRMGSPAEVASLEERLESVVVGLIHQGKLNFMSALRESLMPWMKSLVRETARRHLRMGETEGGGEGEDSANSKMGDLVRAQEFKDWLTLLENVFQKVMEALKTTQAALNFLRSSIKSESVSVPADRMSVPRSGGSLSSSHSVLSVVTTSEEEVQAIAESIGVDYESLARELEAAEKLNQLEMEDEVTAAMMKGGDSVATVGIATKQETTDADVELEKQDSKTGTRPGSMRNGEVMLAEGKLSVEDSGRLLSECHELLCAVAEFAHGRCTKLLGFRAKAGQLDKLHSNEFTSLVRLIERFVVDTAAVTGRQCPSLRAPLLSHSKKFLEQFHDTRKSKLGLLLDGERWKQTDVPPEIQQIVFALESGSGPLLDIQVSASQLSKEYFVVKGQLFAVVGIVLLLIKMMAEYCQCATDLPTLAYDVMGKLVDIMTFFNTRTCQLVLGAGAVQSIGIKTITARHLGLVYRCLQAIILLIPDLRCYFQRYLSKQHAVLLTQFDRLLQDYQSHCRELAKKLKTIMEDGFVRHLSKWEIKAPIPSASFKAITKQMVKLHEALVDILPEDQLAGVFSGIEEVLCRHMSQHLSRLGITNNGSTQHGIVNSELMHFKGTIASLEGLDKFGRSLFDIWISSS